MPTTTDGARLLARAIRYVVGNLQYVSAELLARPTPCAAWDLAALLRHVNESLAALYEGMTTGYLGLEPDAGIGDDLTGRGLVTLLRCRAEQLLAVSTGPHYGGQAIAIADRDVAAGVLTAVGAVELAVHAWDIAQACGHDSPIPVDLAEGVLDVLPLVVTDATRQTHFALPGPVPALATPSERVVALVGRSPLLS